MLLPGTRNLMFERCRLIVFLMLHSSPHLFLARWKLEAQQESGVLMCPVLRHGASDVKARLQLASTTFVSRFQVLWKARGRMASTRMTAMRRGSGPCLVTCTHGAQQRQRVEKRSSLLACFTLRPTSLL